VLVDVTMGAEVEEVDGTALIVVSTRVVSPEPVEQAEATSAAASRSFAARNERSRAVIRPR